MNIFLIIVFLAWFVGPTLFDIFGLLQKKNMNVMKNYTSLHLARRYHKSSLVGLGVVNVERE